MEYALSLILDKAKYSKLREMLALKGSYQAYSPRDWAFVSPPGLFPTARNDMAR